MHTYIVMYYMIYEYIVTKWKNKNLRNFNIVLFGKTDAAIVDVVQNIQCKSYSFYANDTTGTKKRRQKKVRTSGNKQKCAVAINSWGMRVFSA